MNSTAYSCFLMMQLYCSHLSSGAVIAALILLVTNGIAATAAAASTFEMLFLARRAAKTRMTSKTAIMI